MKFYVLTLFPEMIEGGLMHSMLKRASDSGKLSVECVNIRDFSTNKHKTVDDYPYGGGAGMVMTPQPVYDAFLSVKEKIGVETPRVLFMTPQGKPFSQKTAAELADYVENKSSVILLCGHYEGIDERIIEEIVTDEISLGDFVLTGGEIAAMAIVDAVARLLPDVLGNEGSAQDESFSDGLLEYPQYTRPPVWMGKEVPEVLLSGHHGNVDKWRKERALERTMAKRPDLRR